jgi:hypothetical protein
MAIPLNFVLAGFSIIGRPMKEFCLGRHDGRANNGRVYLHDRRVCSEGILWCGHDGRANNNFVLFLIKHCARQRVM